MDHVLFEIHDKKGLLKNERYETWKEEVIKYLLKDGFVELEEHLYVITSKGDKVIDLGSFLNYDKNITKGKSFNIVNKRGMSLGFIEFWMFLLFMALLSIVLIWFLMKYKVAVFLV